MNNTPTETTMEQKIANVLECTLIAVAAITLTALPVAFFAGIIASAF